ncbi:SGNH/GDSL hydrolase family protein [Cryobacterium sp. 5B3]|uniref:SGNH/GDSL hydrolase family protein n=1 Tax=Cryobacterium sp. 5B3 TaxID=3048586 RepID=UPI002AB4650E|nr:SGNH/GDSL hydrolase family protein [Cryobacterium sp. 5B3]MDY7540900.1 SGNH/GDSL hydrolase family protein [Cryobacterium sp. 5B3]MEB0276419.1 SGNH/GDSL hydrolase family protein [Cryobacterium sp. 5B3]
MADSFTGNPTSPWRPVSLLDPETVVAVGAGGVPAFRLARQTVARAVACANPTSGEPVHVSNGSGRVVVLGDSYSTGYALANRGDAWVDDLGISREWDVTVVAVDGTGYTNGGDCGGQSYAARLDVARGLHPDTLIIQGGLNDWQASPTEVEAAADALLDRVTDIRSVVLVGPNDTPAQGRPDAINAALEKAAGAHSRTYISALDWSLSCGPDGMHMTPAGQVEFAAQVADNLPVT